MDSKDLKEMSDEGQTNYWLGKICIAIGNGDIRTILYQMMFYYRQEAFQRGVEEGLRQAKEKSKR